MLTPEEFEQIVIDYLMTGVNGAISGSILHWNERLTDGDQDITVKTLTSTDGDYQLAFVLVSFYCKDVKVTGENQVDYKPNPLLNEVVRLIYDALGNNEGKYWPKGNLGVTTPGAVLLRNIDQKEHFYTIRVKLKVHSADWNNNN